MNTEKQETTEEETQIAITNRAKHILEKLVVSGDVTTKRDLSNILQDPEKSTQKIRGLGIASASELLKVAHSKGYVTLFRNSKSVAPIRFGKPGKHNLKTVNLKDPSKGKARYTLNMPISVMNRVDLEAASSNKSREDVLCSLIKNIDK